MYIIRLFLNVQKGKVFLFRNLFDDLFTAEKILFFFITLHKPCRVWMAFSFIDFWGWKATYIYSGTIKTVKIK